MLRIQNLYKKYFPFSLSIFFKCITENATLCIFMRQLFDFIVCADTKYFSILFNAHLKWICKRFPERSMDVRVSEMHSLKTTSSC